MSTDSSSRAGRVRLNPVLRFFIDLLILLACMIGVRMLASAYPDHGTLIYLSAGVVALVVAGVSAVMARRMTNVSFLALFFAMLMVIRVFEPPFWVLMVGAVVVGLGIGVADFFVPRRGGEGGSLLGGRGAR